MARKYELKRRAERQEETRQRIVEAVAELHATVGPAQTTISAVAERAGVQRLTVYRHFPDERALLSACSRHFLTTNPPPDPSTWRESADPEERLRRALAARYAYFRRNAAMLANVRRDLPLLPVLAEVVAPSLEAEQQLRDELFVAWDVSGERRALLAAAIGHAVDFHAWYGLTAGQGLNDAQAVEVMVGAARAAAGRCR